MPGQGNTHAAKSFRSEIVFILHYIIVPGNYQAHKKRKLKNLKKVHIIFFLKNAQRTR